MSHPAASPSRGRYPKTADLDEVHRRLSTDLESVGFQVQIAAKPGETLTDRTDRALDRLRYLLGPSSAHAQLFPSTLDDSLRLGKGRYRLIQVESAQNLLVEKFYLGPTSTRPNCNAARSGLFHINSSRQVSYCNATAWVPIGGVLRQATPPTCSDSQPVRLYEDSDDDGLYRCVGTTWTKIADDGDQDGFVIDIDADDADDAVFARNLTADVVQAGTGIGPSGDVILTGTLRYETMTTYTGSDVQLTISGVDYYINSRDNEDCGSFVLCRNNGDLEVVSYVVATLNNINHGESSFFGKAIGSCSSILSLFNDINSNTFDVGNLSLNDLSEDVISQVVCTGIGG